MFQQMSNSNPQLVDLMINSAQTAWQSPEIVGILSQAMEQSHAQLQQMQNDPQEAHRQILRSMEDLSQLFQPRDPDHFSSNTAAALVQRLRPFVCYRLKWGEGEGIFSMIIDFLIDPMKRDFQAQPFRPSK